MIYNQENTQAPSTSLRKHLVIGATSMVAASALLGVGAAGASAATVQPTPAATHSSSTVRSHHGGASLLQQLRTDLFQGQISGARAQALAGRILDNSAIASALPADLKSDLTALKSAPATDAVAEAQQIRSTALDGGYGPQLKQLATDLRVSAAYPISTQLISQIRADVSTGAGVGATGAGIAKTVSEHPRFFAKLPTKLQSDATALTKAPDAEKTVRVLGIESAAAAGSYGQQIQTLAQSLLSQSGTSTK
jgi:hypothetical protein